MTDINALVGQAEVMRNDVSPYWGRLILDLEQALREVNVSELEARLCADHAQIWFCVRPAVPEGCPECRIEALTADRAFYKSCALSGEVPKEGAEPSVAQEALEPTHQDKV